MKYLRPASITPWLPGFFGLADPLHVIFTMNATHGLNLALRGLRVALIERHDLTDGTSGRYHGLLHSGGRYAVRDPESERGNEALSMLNEAYARLGDAAGGPPAPVGDVGPNHYVVMSNVHFAVLSKTGTPLYGPAANNTLWTGFGDETISINGTSDRTGLRQFLAVIAQLAEVGRTAQTRGWSLEQTLATDQSLPIEQKLERLEGWAEDLNAGLRASGESMTSIDPGLTSALLQRVMACMEQLREGQGRDPNR